MHSPSIALLRLLILFNNRVTRWRRVRTSPERLLLLVAHCLQYGDCGRNLLRGGGEGCARCGRCPVDAILALSERYGVQCQVAGGGRQALARVRVPGIDAVVAVACERELVQGILGVFPKPALAVRNTRPKGDCHDTQVDLAEVERAVRELLADPVDPIARVVGQVTEP